MSHRLTTKRLFLRELGEDDVSETYRAWLADPSVNRYLETRFVEQTIDRIKSFVSEKRASPTEHLFGIFVSGRHVGNIKLGPVQTRHALADVSYLIGARDAWGHGYATEAIRGVSRFGFDQLGLNKLSAGVYAPNIGSARALENAGYRREGVRRGHYLLDGEPVDLWEYGLRPADIGR